MSKIIEKLNSLKPDSITRFFNKHLDKLNLNKIINKILYGVVIIFKYISLFFFYMFKYSIIFSVWFFKMFFMCAIGAFFGLVALLFILLGEKKKGGNSKNPMHT